MEELKKEFISLIEIAHSRYVEYEKAFENVKTEIEIEERLKDLVSKGIPSEEDIFTEEVLNLAVTKPMQASDVRTAALHFFFYAKAYRALFKENLPESLQKEYETLPLAKEIKFFHRIEGGVFKAKEDTEPFSLDKNYVEAIHKSLKTLLNE